MSVPRIFTVYGVYQIRSTGNAVLQEPLFTSVALARDSLEFSYHKHRGDWIEHDREHYPNVELILEAPTSELFHIRKLDVVETIHHL